MIFQYSAQILSIVKIATYILLNTILQTLTYIWPVTALLWCFVCSILLGINPLSMTLFYDSSEMKVSLAERNSARFFPALALDKPSVTGVSQIRLFLHYSY